MGKGQPAAQKGKNAKGVIGKGLKVDSAKGLKGFKVDTSSHQGGYKADGCYLGGGGKSVT